MERHTRTRKSQDDGSAQRDIIPNTYDAHGMWGLSDFDVTHILTVNYMYELPFFKNQAAMSGKLLGGWQISGISQFQTGTTCGFGVGQDNVGVGQDGSFNCGGQLWNLNGVPEITHDIALNGASEAKYWFKTTDANGNLIVSKPAAGTFNNTPGARNTLHNPGFQNWNVGLYKKFAINEKTGFQFRAQAFNVFNHPELERRQLQPHQLVDLRQDHG